MLEQSRNFLPKFKEFPMYGDILNQQHDEIQHILRTLEIPKRHVRSIDFLGSALKFVAGTPDHDDYTLLLTKQHFLIENNNKQTKINSVLQNRINEITDQFNSLKKNIIENAITKNDRTPFFEFLSNRNNLIINYLNHISLSIILAKHNLINPLILDETEIDNIIDLENLPVTVSNLLLATKVKVLQNENVIHYILKVPKLTKFCNFLKIFPVSHNNSIVKLETDEAAKCSDRTYPINECVKTNAEHICMPKTSQCLSELLNNNSASCPSQSSYHLEPVHEVEDGIIILNDVFPTSIEDDKELVVKGTFLIMFSNSIKINNTAYKIKKNVTTLEAHPPKTVSMKFLEHDHKISLPFLHRINIENTNQIESLTDEMENHRIWWWSITSLMIMMFVSMPFIFCVVRFAYRKCRNPTTVAKGVTPEQLQNIIEQLRFRSSSEEEVHV